MGMFDYVRYEAPCWRCNSTLDSWQSKDGECELKMLMPSDVDNFYTFCRVCGAWNEFDRVRPPTPEFERSLSERAKNYPDLREADNAGSV